MLLPLLMQVGMLGQATPATAGGMAGGGLGYALDYIALRERDEEIEEESLGMVIAARGLE